MNFIYGRVKNNEFMCNISIEFIYKKVKYQIAFDGNIYNSGLLKQELIDKGYYFETCLKEEVILKSFIEHGNNVVNKFSGDFAIIIWDNDKKELILIRDCFSLKSIYYKLNNQEIIFSTDFRSLLNDRQNVIDYEKFAKMFFEDFAFDELGLITNDIAESTEVLRYYNKTISLIFNKSKEQTSLFDEILQVILPNIKRIYLVKLGDKKFNEIDVVSLETLRQLNEEMTMISKFSSNKFNNINNIPLKFSEKILEKFLNEMNFPFFNIAEYNLMFVAEKLSRENIVGIVDVDDITDINNKKRFYNISLLCNKFDIQLAFPKYNKKNVINIDGICPMSYVSEETIEINELLPNKIIKKNFEKSLSELKYPLSEMVYKECDCLKMLYIIRLNNWIKYNNIFIK